ncbi:MAG TPA: D-sedoheptulose 7-phosphate isomerase [Terracidiphilus sp.]|jgi:D-sedoheptulose 7-phosphate isomerase|nr:D-sedoheptulose 7-phosphate isomerase [Terracidiphilus sp.]
MSTASKVKNVYQKSIAEHLKTIEAMADQQSLFEKIADQMSRAVLGGHKILWCGNGGSAADSQHLAAELMGRFKCERQGLPSIAMTTDTSILTAIGNDYGYERVFQRQVEALCTAGDVVVGISTSGNSRNVCAALETARKMGAFTVALTGEGGGAMAEIAEAVFRSASKDTARIQEAHILFGHMLCDWIEQSVCERDAEIQHSTRS